MSFDYLLTWMMVLLRSVGIVLLIPTLAGRPLPVTVRVALSMCLATLVAGVVPLARLPAGTWDLAYASAGEVLLGLAMGFVGRLTFAAVEMAGRIITTAAKVRRPKIGRHTSELQSPMYLVWRLLLEKKKNKAEHSSSS